MLGLFGQSQRQQNLEKWREEMKFLLLYLAPVGPTSVGDLNLLVYEAYTSTLVA